MKIILALMSFGLVSLASADYSGANCPHCNGNLQGYNQQSNRDNRSNSNWDSRNNQNYYSVQDSRSNGDSRDNQNYYNVQDRRSNNSVLDQDIHKKIHDALASGWFSKGYPNVSFNVSNGNVTLNGSVESIENKDKVEDTIRKIDGVKNIYNQISVDNVMRDRDSRDSDNHAYTKNDYSQDQATTQEDRELNAKIRDKLKGWFSKGYDAVILRTNNGAVVLIGTVDNTDDVKKVEEQVKKVDGVRSVNNQLNVKK